jgi:transcriptional regulator with XRE-family HTH domain
MQDPDTQALAQMIRREREKAGVTQSELAVRIGVPQSFVSKCETGERRIGMLDVRSICNALGVPLGEFTDRLEKALR